MRFQKVKTLLFISLFSLSAFGVISLFRGTGRTQNENEYDHPLNLQERKELFEELKQAESRA